jgi:hypothetical protein
MQTDLMNSKEVLPIIAWRLWHEPGDHMGWAGSALLF